METSLSATLRADYAVNGALLDRITLTVFRLNQAATSHRLGRVLRPLTRALDLFWIQGIVGAELPPELQCGPGLRLPHCGRGVIVNAYTVIGSGVTLYHRTTLGQAGRDVISTPTIEDGVYIGTGATVVGKIRIGANAKVGAGAVVVKDVPAGSTAVGVPATNKALLRPSDASDDSSARVDAMEPVAT